MGTLTISSLKLYYGFDVQFASEKRHKQRRRHVVAKINMSIVVLNSFEICHWGRPLARKILRTRFYNRMHRTYNYYFIGLIVYLSTTVCVYVKVNGRIIQRNQIGLLCTKNFYNFYPT